MSTVTMTLTKGVFIAGTAHAAGESVTVDRALAAELITNGQAAKPADWDSVAGERGEPARVSAAGTLVDESGAAVGLAPAKLSADLAALGVLTSGQWQWVPSIFRLQMTGTGTVTLDSRDALGNITTGVYTVTLSGATNEIGFPYAGDAAVSIRATLTGSATAKVI